MSETGAAQVDAATAPDAPKKRSWGVDTYSKWDNMEDEEEQGDLKNSDSAKTTYFSPGKVEMNISEVDHLAKDVDVKRLKDLPQRDTEVWQVVIRKLRVWSKAEKQDTACRPYCMFITCLYPESAILLHELSKTPEEPPSPAQVANALISVMLSPPAGQQRRPGKLTFPSPELAGELFRSMERVGVECSPLSESEGVDEMVKLYSDQLVRDDIARRGPNSESPSLLDAGLPLASVRDLYETSAAFAEAAPWEQLAERQVFQVEVLGNPSGSTTAFVAAIGNDSTAMYGTGKGAFGVAVFFSRLDAEARLCPPGHEVFRDASVPARCSKSGLTAQEVGHELKRTKPRRFDLRTGLELQYKDADALRAHWPTVKKFARPLVELEDGLKEKREHWAEFEATLLFNSRTMVPFSEHDMIEHYKLQMADPAKSPLGDDAFPAPMEMRNGGSPQLASSWRLEWVTRAIRASAYVASALHNTGFLRRPGNTCDVEVANHSTGQKETLRITSAPVYMVAEVNAALARSKEAQQKAKDISGADSQVYSTQSLKEEVSSSPTGESTAGVSNPPKVSSVGQDQVTSENSSSGESRNQEQEENNSTSCVTM